jgi:Zn-dependent oligopeptidase
MTNQEKANLYEVIISEGDRLNREKSKIKAENAGINISPENQKRLTEIDQRLSLLENRLNELIR